MLWPTVAAARKLAVVADITVLALVLKDSVGCSRTGYYSLPCAGDCPVHANAISRIVPHEMQSLGVHVLPEELTRQLFANDIRSALCGVRLWQPTVNHPGVCTTPISLKCSWCGNTKSDQTHPHTVAIEPVHPDVTSPLAR